MVPDVITPTPRTEQEKRDDTAANEKRQRYLRALRRRARGQSAAR